MPYYIFVVFGENANLPPGSVRVSRRGSEESAQLKAKELQNDPRVKTAVVCSSQEQVASVMFTYFANKDHDFTLVKGDDWRNAKFCLGTECFHHQDEEADEEEFDPDAVKLDDPNFVRYPYVTVPLVGEDGNAIAIVGRVCKALRQAKAPQSDIDAYRKSALAGTYEQLLQTTMGWVKVT